MTNPSSLSKIVINDVVYLDPANPSTALSHPNVVSFRSGSTPPNIDDVKLTLKKRRRVQTDGQAEEAPDEEAEEVPSELFAKGDAGRLWHAESGFNEVNCNYYIGVRNKRTGKMRLVQTNAVFSMHPYVNPNVGTELWDEMDNQDRSTADLGEDKGTYSEKQKQLLDSFGGRKAIIRQKRYERNRITKDKVDEKTTVQIDEAAKKMIENDAQIGITHNETMTTESSAPPHDSEATTPEEAYPLLALVSPQEMAALNDVADVLVQGIQDNEISSENPGWHPLVWQVLRSIASVGGTPSEARKTRIQCAMHLHYLITLAQTPGRITASTRAKLVEEMAIDSNVLVTLLSRFTSREAGPERGMRFKTAEDVERIVKHAIVMWLHAHGFSHCGMLHELAQALGVSTKTLLYHAINLGCKARKLKDANSGRGYQISLKVPLVFPAIRIRKGRANVK